MNKYEGTKMVESSNSTESIDHVNPRFLPSYKKLYIEMGKSDALMESIEIIARKYTQMHPGDELLGAIKSHGAEFGIRVDVLESNDLFRHLSKMYLTSTYQHFERFVKNFSKEAQSIRGIIIKRKNDDPLYETAIEQLEKQNKNGQPSIAVYEHQLMNYYRLCRNAGAHAGVDADKIERQFKICAPMVAKIQEKYNMTEAPNSFEKISFWDAILLSRISKGIAESFFRSIDYTESEVIEYVKVMIEMNPELSKRLNRLSNKKTRYESAIKMMACSSLEKFI